MIHHKMHGIARFAFKQAMDLEHVRVLCAAETLPFVEQLLFTRLPIGVSFGRLFRKYFDGYLAMHLVRAGVHFAKIAAADLGADLQI